MEVMPAMLWLPTSVPNKAVNENRQQWGYGLPEQASKPDAPPRAAAEDAKFPHLRGDVVGGIAAAVLTIPVSMGYGLLALAPLGDAFVPHAIMAGLFAPVCGCIVALLLRANTTMVYSPRSIVTFLIGAFVLHSLVRSEAPALEGAPPQVLLVLALAALFLAGLFQAVFGLLKLGSVIKYVPAPVIAGFQNAAAILIFMSQVKVLFGAAVFDLARLPAHLAHVQWPGVFVGVLTCMLMLRGARITKRVPPTIVGFFGGLAVWYLLALAGVPGLGPVVGAIPSVLPELYVDDFWRVLGAIDAVKLAPTLIGGALSLAIVASLDALLCARLVQADAAQRVDDNRELVRLGAGNMVAACFGSIANGINLGSSFANHRSGGRTALSVLVHAAVVLLAAVVLWPLIAYLPRVVIAGLLLAIAVQLVDRWTIDIAKNVVSARTASGRRLLTDLVVIGIVTVSAVVLDIMAAVLIGTAVTVLFFLLRMSKSVIRRSYRCDAVHSRKTREPRQMEVLAARGGRILVIELEGALFFGTAEDLAHHVDAEMRDSSCVILDFRRVNDLDSTGAKILVQMNDRLVKQGKHLLLSSIDDHAHIAEFVSDMGVTAALTRHRIFPDADHAIEWAEERVILLEDAAGSREDFPFSRLDIFADLDDEELRTVRDLLERREYAAGEVVFSEGDETKELYILARGVASVRLRLLNAGRDTRLITFSPGTIFGELALLDQEARSASVVADGDLVCYVLSYEHFMRIRQENPRIAITILINVARELSSRLRRATRTIYQLAS